MNQDYPNDIKGGTVIIPGTPYAKELAKFEQFPSQYTIGTEPGNPYQFREFPKMLYRARHFRGKVACGAQVGRSSDYSSPQEYQQVLADAEAFTKDCQVIVNDESEQQKALESGCRFTPQEAVDFVLERDKSIATAAAERAYSDTKMSEAAQREAAEAEEQSDGQHLPEIPEKRKRGRPRKDAN